jgi:hypothetical protein
MSGNSEHGRKALQPFQLSDSTQIPVGEWVCSAAQVMSSSPSLFQAAEEFHGFRLFDSVLLVDILWQEA